MATTTANCASNSPLGAIVDALALLKDELNASRIQDILIRSALGIEDVVEFVAPTTHGYGRRRVVRTDTFEVLVVTWLPGQCTGAHDHAGALSVFKILRGNALETKFSTSQDSLVERAESREWVTGQVGIDPCGVIHEIRNQAADNEPLVSIHVYAPPLQELRRFVARGPERPLLPAFRRRDRAAPVVAIIGGGFSGSMVAAQLARRCTESGQSLHIALVDRQTSLAEGAAYRTPDTSHLLNVPACGMSAWPDRPDDLVQWLQRRDPSVSPIAFVQRRVYGEYLRSTLFDALAKADPLVSIEHHRREAADIQRCPGGGWRVTGNDGTVINADSVVIATGHRPPNDPIAHDWAGSRARYVADPWAALALTSIEPHESVCLLGTGLTTIDVLQSLSQTSRTAAVLALSRRGLMPSVHAPVPLHPVEPGAWIERFLESGCVRITDLSRAIRAEVKAATQDGGQDWRQVIDGLRPYISRLWRALPDADRGRFMRHARPFWEVSRHRMAPPVAENVEALARRGLFSRRAARTISGYGESDGVTLTIRYRGQSISKQLKFNWVVNCTGPGSGAVNSLPTVLASLLAEGNLDCDSLGLGVRTTPDGRALSPSGRIVGDLLIVGTLRKPDLWESTAVPELRQQAATAADVIVRRHSRTLQSEDLAPTG